MSVLASSDIIKMLNSKKMLVVPNLEEDAMRGRLSPAGLNLSLSKFVVSTSKRDFNDLYIEDTKVGGQQIYTNIAPHDTVLIMTHEFIWVSSELAGTFHAKVDMAARGLGQISTTLDPGWQGPLLVPFTNVGNREARIRIASKNPSEEEFTYETFVTLMLYKVGMDEGSWADMSLNDNTGGRFDILHDMVDTGDKVNEVERVYMKNRVADFNTFDDANSSNFEKAIQDFEELYDKFWLAVDNACEIFKRTNAMQA